MIKLNTYISEAWSGVKQQAIKVDIEAWCDEMGIKKYTINSQGEIDVDRGVNLGGKNFEELPFKFGRVKGGFMLAANKKLKSLKNCPDYIGGWFSCDDCVSLDSLDGCPKEVKENFWCTNCKRKFTKKEVMSLCKVKGDVMT